MSSKAEKDRQKQIQDRCQALLTQMLRDDDNKYCVDCDAKGPRWASWNLGIFLCIRCAGIHRNLGVHISKVKSVNLDSWTPEQVVCLEQMGNSRARAVYEANLPDSFRRPQTDSALESFIRAKYEHKKYIAREWCPPPMPKVNWDKELEEEEKLRKKKRESKNNSTILNNTVVKKLENVIPAPLPKPASSPKTNRNSAGSSSSQTNNSGSQPASADLLGLDTPTSGDIGAGDEIFGSLVSAVDPSKISSSSRSQEEQNFFNQQTSGPTQSQNKKLSNDSILALYNSTPTHFPAHGGAMYGNQPFNQFPPVQNGLNSGNQSNMNNFMSKLPPTGVSLVQNPMPQMFNQSSLGGQQQFGGGHTSMMMQQNLMGPSAGVSLSTVQQNMTSMSPMTASLPQGSSISQINHGMFNSGGIGGLPSQQPSVLGSTVSGISGLPMPNNTGSAAVPASNPFYRMSAPPQMTQQPAPVPSNPVVQQPLQTNSFVHQISSLSLGEPLANLPTHQTLSNNLWQ